MTIQRFVFAALAGAASVIAPASAQIRWTPEFDSALAESRTSNKVLFLAVHIDGERDCDAIAATHYRDPTLVKLSGETVNLFCSSDTHKQRGRCPRCKVGPCAAHRANERAVRKTILKAEFDDPLRPPLHLFVAPDGKILSSAAGFVTTGELEWMFVDAIRELNPGFTWRPGGRTRAPQQLRRGVAKAEKLADHPPTKAEVQQALKDVKKLGGGRGGWRQLLQDAQKNSRLIMRSPEKRAIDWGQATLRSYRQFRDGLLRDIGRLSPQPWGEVVAEWLEDRSADTRKTAAIALYGLRDPRSATTLRKATGTEEEAAILGRILRALAVSAPTNRSAITTISKIAKSHKQAGVRAHAVVALGKLEEREPITAGLKLALQDPDAMVRTVAAYVIAVRQDRELSQHLASSAAAEIDKSTKEWMDKAMATLRTRDPAPFHDFLETVLDGGDPGTAMDRLRKLVDDVTKGPGK